MGRHDLAGTAAGPGAQRRPGVTLIELLVVIALLVMITAVTVPAVAPSIQQRRQREAARLVSSYISGARSRAMELGRPVSVIIQRFDPGQGSTNLTQAQNAAMRTNLQPFSINLAVGESPPPYSGDFTNSEIYAAATPSQNPPTNPAWPGSPAGTPVSQLAVFISQADYLWQLTPSNTSQIRVGDGIRFNYQGPIYYFDHYNVNVNGYVSSQPPQFANGNPTSPGWTVGLLPGEALGVSYVQSPVLSGVPYQLFRQPTTTSAVTPLQLPEGTVIDLSASGTGPTGLFGGTTVNQMVTFNPDGTIGFVYGNDATGLPNRPNGSIFLLIGKREQVPVGAFVPKVANLADPSSFWIVINMQTGQVTTAENYVPGTGGVNISAYSGNDPTGLGVPRTFASGALSANYNSPVTTTGGN